jgi:hypothetical protein
MTIGSSRQVNADQDGVAGLWRLGAVAMLAMAQDERFAIGFISSSRAGGVKLLRRKSGETVDNLASVPEYHLLAGNFLKYAGHWNDLPVDAHESIALAAPRPGTQVMPQCWPCRARATSPFVNILPSAPIS